MPWGKKSDDNNQSGLPKFVKKQRQHTDREINRRAKGIASKGKATNQDGNKGKR